MDNSSTQLSPVPQQTWVQRLLPRVFMRARWHQLAMVNYEFDPRQLAAYVPPGVELDTWDNRTFVSVIGFLFSDTRVMGMAMPWHVNFIEVNLRFYVRRHTPEGVRRGVVFVKEIVPRTLIATMARWLYNEPYVAMPMRADVQPSHAAYSWREGQRWESLRVERSGEAQTIADGSEEEFITEHYWGYCQQRDQGCVEYQVVHPRWRVWRGTQCAVDIDFARLYGATFAPLNHATPCSAFVAEGSAIEVLKPQRIC